MTRLVLRRLLLGALTVACIYVMTFLMVVSIPGNPFQQGQHRLSPETEMALRTRYHMDDNTLLAIVHREYTFATHGGVVKAKPLVPHDDIRSPESGAPSALRAVLDDKFYLASEPTDAPNDKWLRRVVSICWLPTFAPSDRRPSEFSGRRTGRRWPEPPS